MPQFQTIKSVFNGGEMSPLMDGRTDSEKYATGCRLLENFIVRPYGGVFKRPGTRYGTSGTDVDDTVRLIPFRRSTEVNFVLAFKENAIKVWSYSAGSFTLVTSMVTTYAAADIRRIHFCQLNDVMFLTHPSYYPKRITRATDGTWTFEDVPFQFAPALDAPSDGVTMTLVYDADDWVSGTSYSVGNFVLYLNELYRCKTANTDASFTAAKWDKAVYRPSWKDGQAYVAGEVVEYFGSNYFCITAHTASSANRPGTGAQWVLISITDYRLIASSATFDADEVGSTWLLSPGSTSRFSTEEIPASVSTTTSPAVFVQGTYLARTNWNAGASPNKTTLQLQESLDRINFTTIREWYVNLSNEGTISYTAEAPNTGGWYRWVAVKASATGSGSMTIEPSTGKLDIPFEIQSYSSTTQVKGVPLLAVDSLIPNEVIGTAFPVWRKGAFSETRGYPRTVCFHDSRLWFAGTETEPMRIWGSQTDDFYTFLTGSLDTSGIDVTLAATQANDIQWIASFKRTMVIGTTGEEWTMDSGDQDNALTPSSLRLRRWSRYGSGTLQPLLLGDALLWLTSDLRIREFAYVFEKDGYSAPDMSLLAEHIPVHRGRVVELHYTQSPDPIIWLVYEGGELAGMSYDRENNITAWHRHNFGHKDRDIESLCCIYTVSFGTQLPGDTMVFLMEQPNGTETLESIDGNRMMAAVGSYSPTFQYYAEGGPGSFSDAWQYISGGSYNAGTNQTTFSVGTQFDGCTMVGATWQGVPFLNADGSPQEAVVSSGSVVFTGDVRAPTLPNLIGVAYTAIMIPNRIEIQMQSGSAQPRKWRIARGSFRLFKSMYGNVVERPTVTNDYLVCDYSTSSAINYTEMDEFPVNSFLLWTENQDAILTKNGQTLPQVLNFDWGNACDYTLVSRHPNPFNVLAAILDIEIGDISGAGGS